MPSEETELVTVVIPTHGRAELTDRAVKSVLEQTYPAIELVVVDDGSPVPYVTTTGELPRGVTVRCIRLERNRGPGAAREAGRRLAAGAYISYLDSDDFWAPRFLDLLVSALRAAPGAGMAYCASLAMRGGDATGVFRGSGRACDRFLPAVLWSRPWATSACLWRKSVVDALGSWLPLWSWEDKEYEVRAGCRDVGVVHVAETLCFIQLDAAERLSIEKRPEDGRSFALAILHIARNLEATPWHRDATVRARIEWLLLESSIVSASQDERSLMVEAIKAAWRWSERKWRLAALIAVHPPLAFLGRRESFLRLLRWVRGYRPVTPEHESRTVTSPAMPEPANVGRSEDVPVLILGRGITVLGAIRCLGRRGVPLYVAGSRVGVNTRSRWYRTLPEEGPNEFSEQDLGSRLEQLTIRRMVLLPCSDGWAMAVSRLKPELATRFSSSVAPPETLTQMVDKAVFAETLVKLGLPHPRTVVLREQGAIEALPESRLQGFFLKPIQSTVFAQLYGAKALRFRDRAEALRLFKDASTKGVTVMLQEFIPGPPTCHVFVEGFMDRHGRICGLLARRRMRMFPDEFGNSTLSVSIPLAEVSGAVDTMRRLLDGIGYRGVFSAEFKLDERDGLFKLLEVNARPWWYVDFAARCGVDVCGMAYRDALGEEVEPVTSYQLGRRCVHPRLDLQSRVGGSRAQAMSRWSLLRSWIGAYQPFFSLDDPVPGIVEFCSWIVRRSRQRLDH